LQIVASGPTTDGYALWGQGSTAHNHVDNGSLTAQPESLTDKRPHLASSLLNVLGT